MSLNFKLVNRICDLLSGFNFNVNNPNAVFDIQCKRTIDQWDAFEAVVVVLNLWLVVIF